MAGASPVVFVSYSREDAKWRDKFLVMLEPDVRQRRLEVWTDQREVVGYEWRPQLEHAIARSWSALLLVSPDFLASDFIMEQELPALIEQHATLVCALVKQSRWKAVPELEAVQWAHDPERALAQERDRDGAIVRICEKLVELLPHAPAADQGHEEDDGQADVRRRNEDRIDVVNGVAVLTAGTSHASLFGVPPLPLEFVGREELAEVREALLCGDEGAVGVTGRGLGLHGQGGIGKTVLAAAVARDSEVCRHFPDGVFWITVGEGADLVQVQQDLLARLGVAAESRTATQGRALLTRVLAERQCLLVVDDVWTTAAAAAFQVTGPRGRVLYTTRDAAVLRAMGARVMGVDVLPEPAARQLLAQLVGESVDALPAEADSVLEATGRVALAVALVGAAVGRGGTSWQTLLDQLYQGGETFLAHPYAKAFKAMQVAVAALPEADSEAYRTIAVYPQDTAVPVAAIARYWAHFWGVSPERTRERLQLLADRELLSVDGDVVTLHDLQRDFLLLKADDLSLLHADLLDAYHALLPSESNAWSRLPQDEPYIWEHLVYHLRGAGEGATISALVSDLAYLALRSFRSGSVAAEADLRQAAALYPDHATISWLLRLFAQWSHLFTGQSTVGDIAATLASRTHDAPVSLNADWFASLLPISFLAPRWGLPSAPAALMRVLDGHTAGALGVAFSPDGSQLASASIDRTVRLWDPVTGQPIATLEGHTDSVWAVAFSPDGRQIASASDDGTVRLWDPITQQPTATLDGHTGAVSDVAFSPDGRQLASANDDRTVQLWDPATRQTIATLERHTDSVWGVAFSIDGRQLASVSNDGTIGLWDPATGEPKATLEGHIGSALGVTFSPDGRQLASAGADRTVRLWDFATGQPTATLEGHTDAVWEVAFSVDGRQLASAADDGTVRLWDPATRRNTATLEGHSGRARGVAFSPDGHQIASASDDGTVRLWDPTTDQHTANLEGLTVWVWGVAVSLDGRQLATAGDDGAVRLWDFATGQPTAALKGHANSVRDVAFSPDSCRLASAGADGTVRLWDLVSGQHYVVGRHAGPAFGVAFSPDGRRLASGGDGTVRLWDLGTGHRDTLKGHTNTVRGVAFSPDGRRLASASIDRTVRLWDPTTRRTTATLKCPGGALVVAFSPDGSQLAGAVSDGTVCLWDRATAERAATFKSHVDSVRGVAFSPDGRWLATAGDDRTVHLWDPHQPAPISRLTIGVAIGPLAWGPHGIAAATPNGPLQLAMIDRVAVVAGSPPRSR